MKKVSVDLTPSELEALEKLRELRGEGEPVVLEAIREICCSKPPLSHPAELRFDFEKRVARGQGLGEFQYRRIAPGVIFTCSREDADMWIEKNAAREMPASTKPTPVTEYPARLEALQKEREECSWLKHLLDMPHARHSARHGAELDRLEKKYLHPKTPPSCLRYLGDRWRNFFSVAPFEIVDDLDAGDGEVKR